MVSYAPSNELTLVAHAFVEKISWQTDLRYNLAWSYGTFLEEVPRRLGINKALDTAAAALISSHADLCARQISTETLTKYSLALRTLKSYLDDSNRACASETLCAVMLLLTCQVTDQMMALNQN